MTSRKFGTEAFIFLLTCLLVAVFVVFVLVADERKWFNDWSPAWRDAATWLLIAGWFLASRTLLRKVRGILERKDLEATASATKN
jgi:hypothetical protein